MSEQLQLRRGTASQVAAFTGAAGETVVDTTNNRLVVNDGSRAGGWPHALETVTAIADAPYTALVTDRQVAYSSLTAARVVTLPAASAYPAGAVLSIVDESGACSSTNTITASCAGSDKINGNASSAVLSVAYGLLQLQGNGSNAWTIMSQMGMVGQAPNGASMSFAVLETLVSGLSGASVNASLQIPANCIVFAVGARVVTAITGATSWQLGYGTGVNLYAFGNTLGLAAGGTNYGLVGPTAFYSATTLVLTAAGGNFTAGAVRLSIHLAYCNPSTS